MINLAERKIQAQILYEVTEPIRLSLIDVFVYDANGDKLESVQIGLSYFAYGLAIHLAMLAKLQGRELDELDVGRIYDQIAAFVNKLD